MLKIYGYILATCLLVAYVSAETFDNRTTPNVANPLPQEGTGSTIKLIYGGTPGSSSTTVTTNSRPITPSKPTVISPARQGLTPGHSSSSTVSRPPTPIQKSPTPARQGQTPGGSTTTRPPTPPRSSSKRPTPTAPTPSGSTTSRRPTPGNIYGSSTTLRVTPTNPSVTNTSSTRVTPSGPSTTTSIMTPSPSMSPSTTPAFTSPTETTGMPSGPTTGSELPSSSTGGMPSTTSPELTTSSPMVSTTTPMVSTTSPAVSTTSPPVSTSASESPSSSPMPTTSTPASTTTPVTTSISSSTTMVPTSSTMPSTSSAPTSSSTMSSSSASSESSSTSASSSASSSSSSPSSSTSPSSTTPSTSTSSSTVTTTTTLSTTISSSPSTASTTASTTPSTSLSSTNTPITNTPSVSSSTVTPTTSTNTQSPSYPTATPPANGGGPLTHVQIMFCDKYREINMPQDTIQLTAYLYQLQLAISSFCGVGYGRIGNVYLVEDPSTGNPVIQFDVLPGPGMSTTDVVLMISNEVNKGTFKLTDKNGYTYNVNCPLPMYPMYPWTDYGPCPKLPCKNNGRCMVAITGHYFCECPAGWTGELCDKRVEPVGPAQQKDNLWLLWLLIVPLALLGLLLLLCCFCCCHRCCWWGAAAPQQKVQIIEEDIYQDVPACSERGTVRSCRSACSGRPSIYAIDPVSSPMCVNDAGSTYYSALGRPFAVAFSDNTFSAVGYASNDMGIYNSSGKKMLAPSSCCGDGEIEVIMNGAGRRGSRCGSMYSDAGSGYHSAMGNRYAVAYNDRSFNTYSSMPRVGSIRHYN